MQIVWEPRYPWLTMETFSLFTIASKTIQVLKLSYIASATGRALDVAHIVG